ncbi:MAG: M48 family metalloprotease [Actinobacteria bacterium]|nr:M48 family metalloprotease [Actinomycetota bacterium]
MLIAAPAMVGSLLLLLVLFGWAGRWEPVLMLAWLASAVPVFTPLGERVAVRLACGFSRPSARQRALLEPAWQQVLARCHVDPGDVDLYVQRTRAVNAFAVGGRSVALTTGAGADFLTRSLTEDHLAALLAHELGHGASRGGRVALVAAWLAAPWRLAERFILGFARGAAGRQPRTLLVLVVTAAVGAAVAQAVQQGQVAVAVVLSSLAVFGVLCPLADAAMSRRDEFAADRYAAAAGYGLALAAALRRVDDGSEHRRRRVLERALARHPSVEQRLDALFELEMVAAATPRLDASVQGMVTAPAVVTV